MVQSTIQSTDSNKCQQITRTQTFCYIEILWDHSNRYVTISRKVEKTVMGELLWKPPYCAEFYDLGHFFTQNPKVDLIIPFVWLTVVKKVTLSMLETSVSKLLNLWMTFTNYLLLNSIYECPKPHNKFCLEIGKLPIFLYLLSKENFASWVWKLTLNMQI